MVHALIIESPNLERNDLNQYLRQNHFVVESGNSWENAGTLLQQNHYDIIISTQEIPEILALPLAQVLNDTPIILLTGAPATSGRPPTTEMIPVNAPVETIKSTIEKMLLVQKLKQENQCLRAQLQVIQTEVSSGKNNRALQTHQITLVTSLILNINQLQNLNEVLRITCKELFKLFGVDVCFIHLWERPKGSLRLAWLSGEPDKQKLQVDYLKKNNVEWWQQIIKHETIIIEPGQTDFLSHPLGKSDFQTVWYFPLTFKRKLLGLMTLGFVNRYQISEDIRRLLHLICFQLGLAIENIQLKQEQARRSQEIQERNEELRSFIYTVSHDLKSPLVALYGFADLLQENFGKDLDETGQDYLRRILMNSELMHRMIDDLLELSRIGRVLGPRVKFSTRRLLEELAAIHEYQMQKKNIKLIYPKKMPLIYADRERIATVFQNLLTNAIKYHRRESQPEITVDWVEQKDDYRFSISDNGIGINPLHLPHIFDLFKKFGDESHQDGTGVGLTIVKKILEHHGGKIWVESTENVGSTFYFTIPKYSRVK